MFARKSFVAVAVLSWLGSRPPELPAADDRYFDSDGVKIRYIVEGEGEPVLLIHGFAANLHWQWVTPGLVKRLAKNYQVIAFDNRGHGLSGAPHDPEEYGLEMVEDVVRLLDHLGIERAHIVGYSMGAFITNALLARYPERVITATLGGAGWARENDEGREFVQELAESLDRGEGIGPLLIRLTPEGRPKPKAWWLKLINRVFRWLNDQRALAAAVRGMREFVLTEDQLRANRAPALAVIGEVDPLRSTVDDLKPVMSNLNVVVIDDADHMQTFFRPEFHKSIEEFLLAHSKRPAKE